MTLTIKQLAAKLNISPATVSLALNGDKRVAAKTVEKVKKISRELNYIPNNFGRGLQSSRSRLIGYLLGGITASFYDEILQGIGEACVKSQYGLLVGVTDGNKSNFDEQITLFIEKNIDGLILSLNASDETTSLLNKHKIPFVFCSVENFFPECSYVRNDDFKGGQLAAEHLVELGHSFCACCTKHPERLQGNLTVLRKNHCAEPVLFDNAEELEQIMPAPERPTAIIAYSDFQAIEIMHVMSKLGLAVPRDVSLVGTDDLWFADLAEFSFTTVAQSRKDIGRISVKLLLDKIVDKEPESILLPPELVVRNSTAVPKGK